MTNIVFKINFSLLLKIESFIINRYIISDINIANIAVNFPPTNIIKRLKIIIIILHNLFLISVILNNEYIAIIDIADTPISCN